MILISLEHDNLKINRVTFKWQINGYFYKEGLWIIA